MSFSEKIRNSLVSDLVTNCDAQSGCQAGCDEPVGDLKTGVISSPELTKDQMQQIAAHLAKMDSIRLSSERRVTTVESVPADFDLFAMITEDCDDLNSTVSQSAECRVTTTDELNQNSDLKKMDATVNTQGTYTSIKKQFKMTSNQVRESLKMIKDMLYYGCHRGITISIEAERLSKLFYKAGVHEEIGIKDMLNQLIKHIHSFKKSRYNTFMTNFKNYFNIMFQDYLRKILSLYRNLIVSKKFTEDLNKQNQSMLEEVNTIGLDVSEEDDNKTECASDCDPEWGVTKKQIFINRLGGKIIKASAEPTLEKEEKDFEKDFVESKDAKEEMLRLRGGVGFVVNLPSTYDIGRTKRENVDWFRAHETHNLYQPTAQGRIVGVDFNLTERIGLNAGTIRAFERVLVEAERIAKREMINHFGFEQAYRARYWIAYSNDDGTMQKSFTINQIVPDVNNRLNTILNVPLGDSMYQPHIYQFKVMLDKPNRAGCSNDLAHEHHGNITCIFDDSEIMLKTTNPRSTNNDCGIACLKKVITNIKKKKNKSIRKTFGFKKNYMLTHEDLDKICSKYEYHLQVFMLNEGELEVTYEGKNDFTNKVQIFHKPEDHYVLITEFINYVKCTGCNKILREDNTTHKCNENKISYWKRKNQEENCEYSFYGYQDSGIKEENIIYYDFETSTEFNDLHTHVPYYVCMRKANDYINFEGPTTLKSMFEYLNNYGVITYKCEEDKDRWETLDEKEKEEENNLREAEQKDQEIVLVSYNGCRFDDCIFLSYIEEIGLEYEKIENNGRIMNLTWKNNKGIKILHWDLCLFVGGSLRGTAENFGCVLGKGNFDHNLIKGWKDVEKYKDLWEPYCQRDVDVLRELFIKFRENIRNINGPRDLFKYCTLGQLSEAMHKDLIFKPVVKMTKNGERTVYECDFEVEIPNGDKNTFIRSAIYGGKTLAIQKDYRSKHADTIDEILELKDEEEKIERLKDIYQDMLEDPKKDFIVNLDVCSLYPTAMKEGLFPNGKSRWSDNPEKDYKMGLDGFYQINAICPDDLMNPILPRKDKTGTIWSLEPIINECYGKILIDEAIKYGYEITFVKALVYDKKPIKPFDKYVDKMYKIKKEQDILLMNGDKTYNKSLREVAKLQQNSLFGKTIQNTHNSNSTIVKNYNDYCKFISDNDIDSWRWIPLKDGGHKLMLNGSSYKIKNNKPCHWGVYILDQSKVVYNNYIAIASPDMKTQIHTYTDTDSLHILGKYFDLYNDKIGKELGQVSNDIKGIFPLIIEERNLGPKNYWYRFIDKDGRIGEINKAKGIPKSFNGEDLIDTKWYFDDAPHLVHFENAFKKCHKPAQKDINEGIKPFEIKCVPMKRTFNGKLNNKDELELYTWNKMRFHNGIWYAKGYNIPEIDGSSKRLKVKKPKKSKKEKSEDAPKRMFPQTELKSIRCLKWWSKQEPVIKEPESVIKWVSQTQNGKDLHHFANASRTTILKILHEKIKNMNEPCMIYELFTNDCRLCTDLDCEGWVEAKMVPARSLQKTLDIICLVAKRDYNVDIDKTRFRICSATTDKKMSFHIGHLDHITPKIVNQKEFFIKVSNECFKDPDLMNPTKHESIIDASIYTTNRPMRTILSQKPNKQLLEPIELINGEIVKLDINKVDLNEYLFNMEFEKPAKYSEISREECKRVKYKPKNSKRIVNEVQKSFKNMDPTLIRIIKENTLFRDFKIYRQKGNTVELERIRKGFCLCCKDEKGEPEEHDGRDGFILLNNNNEPYKFACWKNKDNKINL